MNAILHLSFVGHIVFPSPGAGTGNQEGPSLRGRSILSFLCRDLLLPGTDALSPAWLFRHQFRSWQPGGGQHPLPKVPAAHGQINRIAGHSAAEAVIAVIHLHAGRFVLMKRTAGHSVSSDLQAVHFRSLSCSH